MRIEVTRQKPDENSDVTQYLEFRVYPSPKNGVTLGGWTRVAEVAATSPGHATIHQSVKLGIPVADSWAEATAYSTKHGVSFIWLDDPHNLFQPDLEA